MRASSRYLAEARSLAKMRLNSANPVYQHLLCYFAFVPAARACIPVATRRGDKIGYRGACIIQAPVVVAKPAHCVVNCGWCRRGALTWHPLHHSNWEYGTRGHLDILCHTLCALIGRPTRCTNLYGRTCHQHGVGVKHINRWDHGI